VPDSYQEDLAYIHHAGFGDFAREAAPAILALLQQHGIAGGRIIELGCGSGILARVLADAGYEMCGVDASAAMLEIASRAVPEAVLRRASLHDTELSRARAVLSLGECIGYLPGPDDSVDLLRLFARVAGALEEGGLFVFDVVGTTGSEAMRYRDWRSGQDWCVLIDVDEDLRAKRLRRGIIAFRKASDVWRRSEETHWLQLFTRDEVLSALRSAGFEATELQGYGTRALAPRRMAFAAHRRGKE